MIPLSKRRALERLIRGFNRVKYPDAIWRAGPRDKQNGGMNLCKAVVMHSMVGSYKAAMGELDNETRRASWHFSVLKDGRVYQHYDTNVQAWHAGSAFNNSTIGVEHEGGLNPTTEPLTPAQLEASRQLVFWLARKHGFPLIRHKGLWEHNEVSDAITVCPSRRIPWPLYMEEGEMPSIVWNPDFQRLYYVGVPPVWISDQQQAAVLTKTFGSPKVALSWAELQALGAK